MFTHLDKIEARYATESSLPPIITDDDLIGLPAPVQRYLRHTGIIGKPRIETVRLKYTGSFRLAIDKPWMPMSAVQIYTTYPPSFQWKAHFKIAGLPLLYGQDTYKNGEGHMF